MRDPGIFSAVTANAIASVLLYDPSKRMRPGPAIASPPDTRHRVVRIPVNLRVDAINLLIERRELLHMRGNVRPPAC